MREREEVVLLALPGQLDLVDGAPVALQDLVLDLEVGAPGAVPALVDPLVHVSVVVYPLENLLDLGLVLGVRRADEEVVGGAELGHQRLEPLGVAVGQLLGLQPLGAGGIGHRLAVLVGPGEEEHLLAPLAHVPGQHVGGDGRVGVAQVGLRVDVIDGGGDVEGHALVLRTLLIYVGYPTPGSKVRRTRA